MTQSLPCLTDRHTVAAHGQGSYLDDLRHCPRGAAVSRAETAVRSQKHAIPNQWDYAGHRMPCMMREGPVVVTPPGMYQRLGAILLLDEGRWEPRHGCRADLRNAASPHAQYGSLAR